MASKYIHFTESEKEQARLTDIVSLLQSQGETVKRSGSEYEWFDGTQKVTIRGHLWYHQYEEVGGDAIDFVRKFMNKDYPDAVEYLLHGSCGRIITSPNIPKRTEKHFELPPKNNNMRRVYAYLLKQRGINKDVLDTFVRKGLIYESANYHNAVFVGIDKDGNARHAHKRGTAEKSTYKGNAVGSMPEYSFHWYGQNESSAGQRDKKLYLFEAPIDMLSFISMNKQGWQHHSYAAACSVSDRVLFQMLKDDPYISKVYLCLDSDDPGQTAAKRISDNLIEKGILHEILVPLRKDWNEDLLLSKHEQEEPCYTIKIS